MHVIWGWLQIGEIYPVQKQGPVPEGLKSATITLDSKPVVINDGLTLEMPQTMSPAAGALQ